MTSIRTASWIGSPIDVASGVFRRTIDLGTASGTFTSGGAPSTTPLMTNLTATSPDPAGFQVAFLNAARTAITSNLQDARYAQVTLTVRDTTVKSGTSLAEEPCRRNDPQELHVLIENRSHRGAAMSVLRGQERSTESGIALVISLVTLLILTLIGFGLLVSSDGSTRTETDSRLKPVPLKWPTRQSSMLESKFARTAIVTPSQTIAKGILSVPCWPRIIR